MQEDRLSIWHQASKRSGLITVGDIFSFNGLCFIISPRFGGALHFVNKIPTGIGRAAFLLLKTFLMGWGDGSTVSQLPSIRARIQIPRAGRI